MFHLKNFAKRLSAGVGGLVAAVGTALAAVPAVVPVVGISFDSMVSKAAKQTQTCFKYALDAKGAHPIFEKKSKNSDEVVNVSSMKL